MNLALLQRDTPLQTAVSKLSILIPVYNEWKTIRELLEKLLRLPFDMEIIVVDDGSSDGTKEILAGIAHPQIRVLRHPANRGKGAAIRTGLAYVTGDVVVIQDADMEQVPEEIGKIVAPILEGRAAVVFGSRLMAGRPEMTWTAYAANVFLSGLTTLLYRTRITDMETAYKAFRADVLKKISFCADGFEFEPEITAKLLRGGVPILEVPVKMDWYRGYYNNTKKVTWRDGVRAVATLFKYRFRS